MTLYDKIGTGYDTRRKADRYITGRLLHHLQPIPDEIHLDLACGTGNYTVALNEVGVRMAGVDQSEVMIAAARRKTDRIAWCVGKAESLPYDNDTFSGVVCVLAVHHFFDIDQAFHEVGRVIGKGRFVIFTATHRQMQQYWLSAYFPIALQKSIDQMPDYGRLERALSGAGFIVTVTEPYEVQPDLQDFFLYSGKHRPSLYLDPQVRASISTFSLLADFAEVEAGCERLARDLASGRINDVIDSHRRSDGDYLFITAEK
jgi:ubiquinone/menaquinone biosynthesis C-methylase UbiE